MVHDEDHLRTNADRLRPVRGVVLDVDGTLLDPAHRITSATRAAVARARDAGWHVLLASGRSPQAEDLAAIGDAENDLGMLRQAGVAIAMGNAAPAVLEAAAHRTAGNDRDGGAPAIHALPAARQGPAPPPHRKD